MVDHEKVSKYYENDCGLDLPQSNFTFAAMYVITYVIDTHRERLCFTQFGTKMAA